MTPLEVAQQRIDAWIQQGDVTQYIDLSGLGLISIPEGMLPPTLQILYCRDNKLTSLPELPPTLNRLQCNYNQLTSLSELLPTIRTVKYSNNPLACPTCRQRSVLV